MQMHGPVHRLSLPPLTCLAGIRNELNGDTLDSIFASGEMMAKYASKRAGIGLEIGKIRPLGAPIRNGEIKHTGLIPFLKKWFADLRSCRGSTCCVSESTAWAASCPVGTQSPSTSLVCASDGSSR